MSPAAVCTTEPTAAERVRSVLSSARSLTVSTDGYDCDLFGPHTLDGGSRLKFRLSADCRLAEQAARSPRGALAALVRFTDVAPTAVRDRVRARVTLSGWLTPDGPKPEAGGGVDFRLDTAHVSLETAADTVSVGLDQLALAEADPLAGVEAGLITHLTDAHADAMAHLTRLVDPRQLQGVVGVWPLALDRYGITLRLERVRTHHDVRLPFPVPLRTAAQVTGQVQALLAAAHNCHRRRRTAARP